ncbi:MAG TPA: TlpA disulfide reductase family protein [Solirubrobacterales bacterium]|nr:TlpA disulfide reductase family protein [Solirubrobacterales bacterium]
MLTWLTVALTGCGGDDGSATAAPDYDAKLAGAPPKLARLHDQANDLLGGGADAFEARLADLRGFPVVVNKWASWCGPCRLEFPHFQEVSADYGERVAFIGVDSDDSDDAAATFLSRYPVPYPSYSDPDQQVAEVFGATRGFPATAFYDRGGRLVYLKQGPYTDSAQFEADLRKYALG